MAASSNSSLSGSSVSSGKFRQRYLPSFHFYLSAARRPARPGLRRDAPPVLPDPPAGAVGLGSHPPPTFPPLLLCGVKEGGVSHPLGRARGEPSGSHGHVLGGSGWPGDIRGPPRPHALPPGTARPSRGTATGAAPGRGSRHPGRFKPL